MIHSKKPLAFWLERLKNKNKTILNRNEISLYEKKISDSSYPYTNDLENINSFLTKDELKKAILKYSNSLTGSYLSKFGKKIDKEEIELYKKNLNIELLQDKNYVQYGLVVERTNVRSIPTERIIISYGNNFDIIQETAIFVGDTVLILHKSRDRKWAFVRTKNYHGWVLLDKIAISDKDKVFSYKDMAEGNFLTITGDVVRTVYVPDDKLLSEIRLYMGSTYPLNDIEEGNLINGQLPINHYSVLLPGRDADGKLYFFKSLIRKSEDISIGYLKYSKENIIRQAFKFLGSRYSWGGYNESCDCSSPMVHVFSSMGVYLPRNASDQEKYAEGETKNINCEAELDSSVNVCDALYMDGHVMIYLGKVDEKHYAIHAVGGKVINHKKGFRVSGVSITTLEDMWVDENTNYLDSIKVIKRFF